MKRFSALFSSKPKNSAKVSGDLLIEFICCWLISVGVLLAMRQLFRFENPMDAIMIRAAAILAVNIALTRRWWMLPAALAGTFGLIFLFAGMTGSLKALISYFSGFFSWWINQFPIASRYERPGTILLVNWIIAILVCTIVFLFVRRIRLFPVILMISATLFIIIGANDFHENMSAVAFIAAGSLPLLVRSHHQHLSRKMDEVFVSPRKIMTAGLVFCVLISLLAHEIVPSDTYSWKNPKLSNWLDKIENSGFQRQDSDFSLESSGLQPNQDKLGGNLSLDHKPMLLVTTNRQSLLKGMVYDTYTGQGWRSAQPDTSFTFNNDSKDTQDGVFNANLPGNNGSNPLKDYMPLADTAVTIYSGGYTVFTSERLTTIQPLSETKTFFFNTRSEVFSNEFLPKKFQYKFQAYLLDRRSDDLTERITSVENKAKANSAEFVDKQYTDLPDNLPPSVSETAKSITAGQSTTYGRLTAIEDYLKSNFKYTLQPGDVPDGEDFVDYFLKTRQGYCVYYASAMAVMARTLHIPSRFVIGYGLVRTDSSWTAYSDTAHAWVECYINGMGWITFDPTAGSGYNADNQGGENNPTGTPDQNTTQETTIEETTATTGSSDTITETQTETETTTENEQQTDAFVSIRWACVTIAMAFILLLALAVLRMLRQSKAYLPENMRRRYPDNGVRTDRYYTDILRQLNLLDFAPETGETIYQHGQRVSDNLKTFSPDETKKDGSLVDNAFEIVMNWRYGNSKPSDSELKKIEQLHDALEIRIRSKYNKLEYALIRLLFAK